MAQTGSYPSDVTSHLPAQPDCGQRTYIGRFAPSPSGPLHMGSLLAALASYLDAKANHGLWLVRMEDLDPPREQPGATSVILKQLEALGLHWDGEVLFQSTRADAYRAAIASLDALGKIYYCTCSRQQLLKYNGVYPGFCRDRTWPHSKAAIRYRIDASSLFSFADLFQGQQNMCADDEGDVVILRRDGLFAYQLAVVVDDAFQKITDIVRGIDLLDSTARQLHLQQFLQYPRPRYGHLPILLNTQGQKLSKQQGARALDTAKPSASLFQALVYLNQNPPPEMATLSAKEILEWAVTTWNPQKLHAQRTISLFVPPKTPAL